MVVVVVVVVFNSKFTLKNNQVVKKQKTLFSLHKQVSDHICIKLLLLVIGKEIALWHLGHMYYKYKAHTRK